MAPAREASDSYVPVADGLRALCVLGVMWFHIWQQSWLMPAINIFGFEINFERIVRSGYLFVDGMLMLSGFLLFLPYARAMLDGGECPSARLFYKKRAARILPSYYLSVLVMLVFIALPRGEYATTAEMWRDLLSHLTLTHVFFPDAYTYTRLNVVLWTISIEAQFYLVFPLLARAFRKWPLAVYSGMALTAFAFRWAVAARSQDTTHLINQFPAMLDVYANGMLAAYAYVTIARTLRGNAATRALFALGAVMCAAGVYQLFKAQTAEIGYDMLRLGQMERRYPLSLLLALFLICAQNALRPFERLFGNRALGFISTISYQAYIWHSFIALRLKEWRIPPYQAETDPQMYMEPVWQWQYTLLCFAASIVAGALITYLFEKPIAKLLLKRQGSK